MNVIIVLLEKGLLGEVPAVRDMVRLARNHHSGDACHALMLAEVTAIGQQETIIVCSDS